MKYSAFLALVCFNTLQVMAQGTAFTYQGRLGDGAGAANGAYDLTFSVWNASNGPSQVSFTITNAAVPVSDGLFNVTLDFGIGAFPGGDRWLEVAVRTNAGAAFATLTPRQRITATPYALTARNLAGVLPNTSLAGIYSGALTLNNAANTFAGNGAGLTGVNAATLGGLTSNQFWKTVGNSGTTPTANFLGTTDNQPLELRVNGVRGLRLQPNPFGGPSIVGGSNTVDAGSPAATIGGGRGNVIQGNGFYSTIGGGLENVLENSAQQVVISGGIQNRMGISANSSAIGGGWENFIKSNVAMSVIAGGWTNSIGPFVTAGAIGGGYQNSIQPGGDYATISGGRFNRIMVTNEYAVIAGGAFNMIENGGDDSTISGGFGNTIRSNVASSVIAGGGGHEIESSSSAIGGGFGNFIERNALNSVIAGGTANGIHDSANSSVIAGGTLNRIHTNANFSAIGGGSSNNEGENAVYSTISGGSNNNIQRAADHSSIGGGQLNTIAPNAGKSVIAGGDGNIAGGLSTTIGGGTLNQIEAGATYSTIAGGGGNLIGANSFSASIPGGYSNKVVGNFSLAGGYRAEANHPNTFTWAGGNTVPYQSLFPNAFNIYASNGVSMDYGLQNAAQPRGARYVYVGPINAGLTISAWNGARLTDGGIWSNASDKNRKTGFSEVNSRDVLEKLAALPVRQWRYTNESEIIKHLGPTAQDFQEAFGLGTDDTSIGTVDADGVALAAIQGLNRKLTEELKRRDSENAELKRAVAELKSLVHGLVQKLDTSGP